MSQAIRVGMTDVAVGGVLFIAAAGVAAGAISAERETAFRVRCASNLKQIGQAILLYSNENRNAYPRTTKSAGDAPPVWGTPYADDADPVAVPNNNCDPFANDKTSPADVLALKPKANDVTAALYLLLRTQDLVPEVFVCPSTRNKRFGFDGAGASALSYTNFPGKAALARSLSYSYQNPYPSVAAVKAGFKLNNAIPAEFAVMADMNPGSAALLNLKATATAKETRPANSLNHDGDGQNILYGDGHVEFNQSPLVGIGRDNIYVANDAPSVQNLTRAGAPAIVGSPADANDSVLLPTAADLGTDQPLPAVVPAAAGENPAKVFAGRYATRSGRGQATMTIDEKTISVTAGRKTVTYDYTVAGTRGDAIVLTLKGNGVENGSADLTAVGHSFYIDSDEPTGLLVGEGGSGPGWSMGQ